MHFNHLRNLFRGLLRFQGRIPKISEVPGSKLGNSTAWAGAALLLGSLALGYWANEASLVQARLSWEKSHLPSERIFTFALQSYGMSRVPSKKMYKAVRSLPLNSDEEGNVWETKDGNWVAYFLETAEALPVLLYCGVCDRLPQQWQSMGLGWAGLETVLQDLEARAREKRLVRPQREFIDPRELRY